MVCELGEETRGEDRRVAERKFGGGKVGGQSGEIRELVGGERKSNTLTFSQLSITVSSATCLPAGIWVGIIKVSLETCIFILLHSFCA